MSSWSVLYDTPLRRLLFSCGLRVSHIDFNYYWGRDVDVWRLVECGTAAFPYNPEGPRHG